MKKYIVFEEEWTDNFYIKLESEHDTTANSLNILQIGVIENFSTGTPFFVLKLIDGVGDFITHTYFNPNETYDLFIGRSKNDNQKFPFSFSLGKFQNTAIGKSESIATDLTFMSKYWEGILKDTHSRSWTNKKYSTVLEELMEEIGIEEYDIEQTFKNHNVIQPDWTNFDLINWIANNAQNQQQIAGFDYVIRSDGKFIFKSFDKFFEQKPVDEFVLAVPGNTKTQFFNTFEIKHDYSNLLPRGGFGLNYTYFDYNQKQFVSEKTKFSDSKMRQLSDWAFISEEHETASKRFYGGRDNLTPSVADNRIANIATSSQKMDIEINGNTDIHVGDIISLVMVPSQYSKLQINERYSGNWLISKITHDIDVEQKTFKTHLEVVRSGFNGVDYKGFVKTQTGKKIKRYSE